LNHDTIECTKYLELGSSTFMSSPIAKNPVPISVVIKKSIKNLG